MTVESRWCQRRKFPVDLAPVDAQIWLLHANQFTFIGFWLKIQIIDLISLDSFFLIKKFAPLIFVAKHGAVGGEGGGR